MLQNNRPKEKLNNHILHVNIDKISKKEHENKLKIKSNRQSIIVIAQFAAKKTNRQLKNTIAQHDTLPLPQQVKPMSYMQQSRAGFCRATWPKLPV